MVNSKESPHKLLEFVRYLRNAARYKIKIRKLLAFLYTSNQLETITYQKLLCMITSTTTKSLQLSLIKHRTLVKVIKDLHKINSIFMG